MPRTRLSKKSGKLRKQLAIRRIGHMADQAPSGRANESHETGEKENFTNAEKFGICAGVMVIEVGDTIPRRVVGFDQKYCAILAGYAQHVPPGRLRAK